MNDEKPSSDEPADEDAVDVTPAAASEAPEGPYWTTRRRFLVGGLATAAVAVGAVVGSAEGVLPGRVRTRRWLGVGAVDRSVPDLITREPIVGTFPSEARRTDVGWALWVPLGWEEEDRGRLPVVVVLHGRGADARGAFDVLGWHKFAAEAFGAGTPPFALVAVDGGSTYWHPRSSGDDPVRMITQELLPRVREEGVGGPVGVWGWSMGGFGALTLARESVAGRLQAADGPLRISAVAASSPALFTSAGEASRGAFDGDDDWRRWGDLLGGPRPDVPTQVLCGADDPFADATRAYVSRTPGTAGGVVAGRHDNGFWRWSAPRQIEFLGRSLAAVA
ncbi:MAG: alpha/beta hydrolase-fold protein [Kineosporiaceae bacterium]